MDTILKYIPYYQKIKDQSICQTTQFNRKVFLQIGFNKSRFTQHLGLRKLTDHKSCNVCYCKVQEVNIGGGHHVLIADDDQTGEQVPTDSNKKKNSVDEG